MHPIWPYIRPIFTNIHLWHEKKQEGKLLYIPSTRWSSPQEVGFSGFEVAHGLCFRFQAAENAIWGAIPPICPPFWGGILHIPT